MHQQADDCAVQRVHHTATGDAAGSGKPSVASAGQRIGKHGHVHTGTAICRTGDKNSQRFSA